MSDLSENDLFKALEHIHRVALASSTRTKRLVWIADRALAALNGDEFFDDNRPKVKQETSREFEQAKQIQSLTQQLEKVTEERDAIQKAAFEIIDFELHTEFADRVEHWIEAGLPFIKAAE